MFIELTNAVLHAIQTLNDAGYEAYAVGGCIRDALLGKEPTDWDITTSATPDEITAAFSTYRTIDTGAQHGTVTVILDDTSLEITTYRIDGDYTDGRHPDSVSFTRSLTEDLRRRDFTINAMAYHPSVGLVDLHGGQMDLRAGLIRCIGEPERRFEEDALRILRALRFASVLGFAIQPETSEALRRLSPTLTRVAAERIYGEWLKLLCGQDAVRIVDEYADVLRVFLPEITQLNNTELIGKVSGTSHARICALFYCANVPTTVAEHILRRLHVDFQTIRRVIMLLDSRSHAVTNDADLLRLLNRLGEDVIFDYLMLAEADQSIFDRVQQLLDNNTCYKISMLAIDGNDIIETGIPAGPDVGKRLLDLLDAVIEGFCSNNREDLLKYLNKMKKPVH